MNILHDQCDVETAKNLRKRRIQPFPVANLHSELVPARQRFQEWEQAVGERVTVLYLILIEVRKLQDHGPSRRQLGPIVLQFPHFDKYQVKDRHAFTDRLLPFLKTLPSGHQFAVEIRNRKWLDATFAEILRSFNVALVMQDIHTMPGPTEMTFDPVTADFSYVRLLGNRRQIEMTTTVWEKVVEDKSEKVSAWVSYCQTVQRRGVKQYVYANNHYEGYGPGTVEKFKEWWRKTGGGEIGKPTKESMERGLFEG